MEQAWIQNKERPPSCREPNLWGAIGQKTRQLLPSPTPYPLFVYATLKCKESSSRVALPAFRFALTSCACDAWFGTRKMNVPNAPVARTEAR